MLARWLLLIVIATVPFRVMGDAPATDPAWPTTALAEEAKSPPLAASRPTTVTVATKPSKTALKPHVAPVTTIVQTVDDTTTGLGWTGVQSDQLLVVLHPQPVNDEPAN